MGGSIESIRPRFVNYRPGRRIAVRYRARVAWPGGRVTRTTLVASARPGAPLAVWRWPADPRLPGARPATDPEIVRGLLARRDAPNGPIALSYLSYWPGRRAVLQVTRPGSREPLLFVKVVRPSAFARLHQLHAALRDSLPVARCVASSEELGILVLEALPGRTLSASLADPEATPPAPAEILELLRELGAHEGLPPRRPRRTTAAKIASHSRLLRHLLPDEAPALAHLAELYGEEAPQPLTTVHGDLHDGQVLARDGRVTGLLDLDDVGPGELVDDLALLIARVRARSRDAYARELLSAFGTAVDPHELRRRAAGALLGRATAPFRVQAPDWRATARERIRRAETALNAWASAPHAVL
jgi:aminoglycoside phosphotransferase